MTVLRHFRSLGPETMASLSPVPCLGVDVPELLQFLACQCQCLLWPLTLNPKRSRFELLGHR